MSSTAAASADSVLAILPCLVSSRFARAPALRAISVTTMTPLPASAAGSKVRRMLPSPAKMPVARPTPTAITTSASTAVLRKLRLSCRSAI